VWHLLLYEAVLLPVIQFHHSNVNIPRWLDRALRIVIASPFMHRVHHSRYQPETDSNYSSVFSFWDRVFGTFRERPDIESIHFGLRGYDDEKHQDFSGLLVTPFRENEALGKEAFSSLPVKPSSHGS
jgi:sterol desaturase/sphingolipid hydroxylase (fatty acid hydroxylase superfamily)